jgi:hypothetical protein
VFELLIIFNTTDRETIAAAKGGCDRANSLMMYTQVYVNDLACPWEKRLFSRNEDPFGAETIYSIYEQALVGLEN